MDWVFFSPLAFFSFLPHPFRKSKDKRGAAATTGFSFSFFLSFTRNIDAIRSLVRQRKSKAIILNTARESRFSQFLTFFLSLSLFLSLCVCAFIICARNRHSDCAFKTTYSLAEFVCLFVHQRKRVIQKKSEMTKKATLSDTENLAVGAAGGILETGIQSTFCFRSHVLFRPFVCVLIDHCCCC